VAVNGGRIKLATLVDGDIDNGLVLDVTVRRSVDASLRQNLKECSRT